MEPQRIRLTLELQIFLRAYSTSLKEEEIIEHIQTLLQAVTFKALITNERELPKCQQFLSYVTV